MARPAPENKAIMPKSAISMLIAIKADAASHMPAPIDAIDAQYRALSARLPSLPRNVSPMAFERSSEPAHMTLPAASLTVAT